MQPRPDERGMASRQLKTRSVVYSGLASRCFMLDAGLAFPAETSTRRKERAGSEASKLRSEDSQLEALLVRALVGTDADQPDFATIRVAHGRHSRRRHPGSAVDADVDLVHAR